MDHYGLRNSGSIDHVEHVPVQVTIFVWYTVFSAWLRKPSGTTNSWRPGSLTSWPSACNKESNAFFGVSCQDGTSWPITFFVSVGITFMAWGAGGGGVCDANKAKPPKWKPCRVKCNNLFKRLPGDDTATITRYLPKWRIEKVNSVWIRPPAGTLWPAKVAVRRGSSKRPHLKERWVNETSQNCKIQGHWMLGWPSWPPAQTSTSAPKSPAGSFPCSVASNEIPLICCNVCSLFASQLSPTNLPISPEAIVGSFRGYVGQVLSQRKAWNDRH